MMNSEDILNLKEIDFNISFNLAKNCSQLLMSNDINENEKAKEIIISILESLNKVHKDTLDIWIDLIESIGFYPYLDKTNLTLKSTPALIRKEVHKSEEINKYFHEEQLFYSKILKSKHNLVLSAPTSFGKSLLIEDIVASNIYNNIVIIQPTLALLDETRRKLLKYKDNYKIIVRTTQEESTTKGNLFLLTAERLVERYYNDMLPIIDFFILDEFYKLSSNEGDGRVDILNTAFNLLVNRMEVPFYFLAPNIDKISDDFEETFNAKFHKTNYSLVLTKKINLYEKDFKNKEYKKQKLFNLLEELKDEQTIIYCSSPEKVKELSENFLAYLLNKKIKPNSNIEELNLLKYSIGIHNGALPKHIATTIIDYFNSKKINLLFCTSTIIEGVNTTAKNVIIFDNKKGRTNINYFDQKNIEGRAGRMMEHYIGKVYNFNKDIEKKEDIKVEIQSFEQTNLSNELMFQLDDDEIKDKSSELYQRFKEIQETDEDLLKLLRKNALNIEGQLNIIDKIENNLNEWHKYLYWRDFPKQNKKLNQLEFVLELAWNNLKLDNEVIKWISGYKHLSVKISKYSRYKNIKDLMQEEFTFRIKNKNLTEKELDDIRNHIISSNFYILRLVFEYKVPKWLNVISNLQRYVYEKHNMEYGDYSIFSTALENGFVRDNLSILLEYGIPSTAIKKLEKIIPSEIKDDKIIDYIKNINLDNINLLEYEKYKIRQGLSF